MITQHFHFKTKSTTHENAAFKVQQMGGIWNKKNNAKQTTEYKLYTIYKL